MRPRYSYRFLFIPGTIGSITWLSLNEDKVDRIKHGLVVVCVGDGGEFTYKKSRRGNAEIDRAVVNVLSLGDSAKNYRIVDFYPYGYDERQFCSPGFNLPIGSLSRTPHGCYPQYHTSADNLEFVHPEYLSESLSNYLSIIDLLEHNFRYLNLNPKCEPQLGKRGLYGSVGALSKRRGWEMALLWVLNLSDGEHSLLDISERSRIPFREIKAAASALANCALLKRC
jgi:aminopeptidase-like protein